MKRSSLLAHLRRHGCYLKREGRAHSLWTNPLTGAVEAVPRHIEIGNNLARKICRGHEVVVVDREPEVAALFCRELASGVMDRRLREQLGTAVPVYPVKGYSATVPIVRTDAAPRHAGIDESRRVAYCPMGSDLRITGGAEFAGYEKTHEPQDFAPLYGAMKQLFPGAADYSRARVRACQRPMTPETTPRFGTGRYQNLWFNIGLGHMGWAMATGAARITADLVCGRTPGIDLEGLRIRRH